MNLGWSFYEGLYQAPPLRAMPTSFAVGSLTPAHWYQLRVTATNDAGVAATIYTYATKTIEGGKFNETQKVMYSLVDFNTNKQDDLLM